MFKTKSRFALLSAIVIVMAMGVMLVGNTFASSVHYDTSAKNANGEYNVSFQYTKERGKENVTYYPMSASTPAFNDSTLWCPGRTEIVYLKMHNSELFPVSLSLSMTKSDVLNTQGFDDTLTYAVINGDWTGPDVQHPSNWASFLAEAKKASAEENTVKFGTLVNENPLLWRKNLEAGASQYLALAIHMDENADSDYMDAVMNLSFNLTVDANYKPGETPAPATDKQ